MKQAGALTLQENILQATLRRPRVGRIHPLEPSQLRRDAFLRKFQYRKGPRSCVTGCRWKPTDIPSCEQRQGRPNSGHPYRLTPFPQPPPRSLARRIKAPVAVERPQVSLNYIDCSHFSSFRLAPLSFRLSFFYLALLAKPPRLGSAPLSFQVRISP